MKKKEVIIFLILFIATCIIFTPFITGHYSTDTYNILNRGLETYAITYNLNDGRIINCIVLLLFDLLGIKVETIVIIVTVLAIFISCITIMIIKNIIISKKAPKNIWQEILILVIIHTIIFNFAYLENMQFIECMVMSFSVLFYTLAAKKIVFDKKYNISAILSIIATLCYQGTIGWFITATLLFSFIEENKINKKLILNVVIAGMLCILSVGVNLLQIKISGKIFGMTQNRMGSLKNIFNNIHIIWDYINYNITNSFYLFPKYLFLVLVIIILWINAIFKSSTKNTIINLAILVFVAIIINYAPNLFTLAAIGTARMCFSLGATIGIMLIYLYCNTEIFQSKTIMKEILIAISILYFCITDVNYVGIMIEHKKVNEINKQESLQIGEYLNEYEREKNIKLKNIVVVYDSRPTIFYNSKTKNKSSLCYRPLYTEWSYVGTINYYNNRDLKLKKGVKDEYTEYLNNRNWDTLNKEQFVFVDDTVYYCVY